MNHFIAIYIVLLYTLVGVSFLYNISFKSKYGEVFNIALSFLVGSSLVTFADFVLSIIGIGLIWDYLFALAMFSFSIFKYIKTNETPIEKIKCSMKMNKINIVLSAVLGVLLFNMIVATSFRGMIFWDAWAMWGADSKIIYMHDGLKVKDENLKHLDRLAKGERNYPFGVPFMQADVYRHAGEIVEAESKVIYTAFLLSMIAMIFAFFRRFGLSVALISSIVPLLVHNFTWYLSVGYVDSILTIFALAGVLLLIEFLEENKVSALYMSSFIFSLSTFIKNDSWFLICPFLVLIFIIFFFDKNKNITIKDIGISLVLLLWAKVFFTIFSQTYELRDAFSTYMNYDVSTYTHYAWEYIKYMFELFFRVQNFGLAWVFSFAVLVLYFKEIIKNKILSILNTFILGIFGMMILVLPVVTRDDDILGLWKMTNVDRLLIGICIMYFVISMYTIVTLEKDKLEDILPE